MTARLLGGLAICWLIPLSPATAQPEQIPLPKDEPAAAAPAQVLVLSLPECVRLALDKQPALAAQQASLAAAETQQRGLDSLCIPTFLSPDLPTRRKQAALGVTIATAGLHQAEWDTVYAVTRTYLSAVYAREVLALADAAAEEFRVYRKTVELVVRGTGKGSAQWSESTVDKISLYLGQAESRQAEARRGVDLALAALREAIGLGPDCCLRVADETLPQAQAQVCRDELIALALARRGEIVQATTLAEVFRLEIDAQAALHGVVTRTFAAGSDIHVRPIPQGMSDGEYRPGAIGPEMPPNFAGHRKVRVERARDLSARADAVVEKTRNLIALEVEDAFLKLRQATENVKQTGPTAEAAVRLDEDTRKNLGSAGAEPKIRMEDVLVNTVLAFQARAAFREALFRRAIALAALERATAGGFCSGLLIPTPRQTGN
jgi:outer membrane protein TolC